MPLALMIALRYLRGRREDGFLSLFSLMSLLSIVLGVGTLVVVMAVMDGFRIELLSRLIALNGQVKMVPKAGFIALDEPLIEGLRADQRSTAVKPYVTGPGLVIQGDQAHLVGVQGRERRDLQDTSLFKDSLISGDLTGLQEGQVFIGQRLADDLGLDPQDDLGKDLRLLIPGSTQEDARLMRFELAGVLSLGLHQLDKSLVLMHLRDAQIAFGIENQISGIEIFAKSDQDADTLAFEVSQRQGQDYGLQDWRQAGASFFALVKTQRNVMLLVLGLIILVAALNIISGQIMLVKGKKRDIGILRTMGATRGTILQAFFWVGGSIGIIGTALGFILGWLFVSNINSIRRWLETLLDIQLFDPAVRSLTEVPAQIEPVTTMLVLVLSLLLTLIASLYPAWKAARMHPIEGVRHA